MSKIDYINEDGFKIVKSKKSRKKFNKLNKVNKFNVHQLTCDNIHIDITTKERRIKEAKFELASSEFLNSSIKILQNINNQKNIVKIDSIVCFGLGNFTSCTSSLYQLAYILLIKEQFGISVAYFHDPVFSAAEIVLLKSLNCQIIEENLEGKFAAAKEEITLFYLPHCPKQLTNNILWKNWNLHLSNIIFICNSFTNLINSVPDRFLQINAGYICKLNNNECVEEFILKNNFKYTDIFNDTSIHTFPRIKLDKQPASLWDNPQEPKYERSDTELITSELISSLTLI